MQNINNSSSTDSAFQWVTIYKAENTLEANIIKGLILASGIECKIAGEMLQGAIGEIPFEQTQVSVQVYVIKERHARQILVNYQQVKQSAPDWVCPNCNEHNGSTFDFCWSCETLKND
ncbi:MULTISPECIES: DUF2007 domain-containing protein [Pseudoalteromonas]|uniref:RanBP2-type domain-containing protein n=1 Tax=Pseudoalteromonas aliena SW19 TaxID=1314866 RepID=A0ABR9E1C9_9GAMM|nr:MULTISPECIES: DUF2007 domain-containing protein [Pseudoalteromonas]MBB1384517.1 DUF2007 domain-containing protein [Pseudoalteromonas sp. SG45-5]MBB1393233.1 DUF2007 domain-containing protein [Pseudoalteromonas sp. SG44-4]MBB1448036.1 DUF2007 domain-containing protein [Pseudoalteromonas sp. SG41-6]MBE0360411.1 hypothetical protein [Pseudoalteromonas aliena SW19]TMO05855.1 hypothetical protein CWB66_05925 [Pseudoalteromonas sp. S558]